MKWIEVNLPYSSTRERYSPPKQPDISAKEITRFDATFDDIYSKLNKKGFESRFDNWLTKYDKWYDNLPEIIEWKKISDEYERNYYDRQDTETFYGQGLAKPGTLIELEDSSIHLIGSVNKNRGVCDDCVAFGETKIVKRYTVVYDYTKEFGDDKNDNQD